jgi:hypothetical protein
VNAASDTVDIAKRGAEGVAKSVVAQAAIRQAVRAEGMKVSTKAVAKLAAKTGKFAGFAGAVLTAASAYEAYQRCMAQ